MPIHPERTTKDTSEMIRQRNDDGRCCGTDEFQYEVVLKGNAPCVLQSLVPFHPLRADHFRENVVEISPVVFRLRRPNSVGQMDPRHSTLVGEEEESMSLVGSPRPALVRPARKLAAAETRVCA